MLKPLALALALCLSSQVSAQNQSAILDFDFIVHKIEKNYAGFADKVTAVTRPAYDEITRKTREKLAVARPDQVEEFIKEWMDFFKDNHLQIGREDVVADPTATELRPALDEAAFKRRLNQKKSLGPYEGIWTSTDDSYRLAILPAPDNPKVWEGIVLATHVQAWKPGHVKLKIFPNVDATRFTYFRRDFSTRVGFVKSMAKGSALDFEGVTFVRSWPTLPVGMDLDRLVPQDRFFLKKLSERTLLLRLPDFHHENKALLEKIISDHKAELGSIDNWVIDLRNNGGGDDSTFEEILKYLYTRPVYTVGSEIYSTVDNVQKYTDLIANPEYSEAEKAPLRRLLERLKAAPNKFVMQDDRPMYIQTRKEILPYPKHVGILIRGAGSSGEQFILKARQSSKVTLFGAPTEGVLDFANCSSFKTPGGFEVQYATSRSLRLPSEPIDKIGIPPDYPISESVDDQVTPVQGWLEKLPDFPVK